MIIHKTTADDEGKINLGEAGPTLIAMMVMAVIETGDVKARQLLGDCWPETDWDLEIGKTRSEMYVEWNGELHPYIPPEAQLKERF